MNFEFERVFFEAKYNFFGYMEFLSTFVLK